MGTVRYMSPEQVRGGSADLRSDLYSLGTTLFEALAGRTPFDGENHFAIMEQHIHRAPPTLASLGVTVPARVEALLRCALEKSPGDRFVSAREFADALSLGRDPKLFATPAPVPLGRRKTKQTTPVRIVIAALVGAGLCAIVAVRLSNSRRRPPQALAATDSMSWPAPHSLTGLQFTVDEAFATDGLRVQSVRPIDASAVRNQYRALGDKLHDFLVHSDMAAARKAVSSARPLPLNLVLLPQELLNRADLWPSHRIIPGNTYASRYIETKQTLFVNDSAGFATRDLPYGVALHVLAPITSLEQTDYLALAERFERYCAHLR